MEMAGGPRVGTCIVSKGTWRYAVRVGRGEGGEAYEGKRIVGNKGRLRGGDLRVLKRPSFTPWA